MICGEVNASKSTVLNTLLQARVLPDNIGNTTRPMVDLSHGAAQKMKITYQSGASKTLSDLSDQRACEGSLSIWLPAAACLPSS